MSASRWATAVSRSALASASRVHLRYATTALRMPAMSPTMTEGGIAGWKKAQGESFATGDVLLEIETDKATIDVEAQDDGVMGKIITKEGSSKIPVGQIIAVLAEEGDDLSAIEIPKDLGPQGSSASAPEQPKSEPKAEAKEIKKQGPKEQEPKQEVQQQEAGHGHKAIKHPKPLFPSVSRLLIESSLSPDQIFKLKGTGKNGMLTKGDVLLAIGQIKNAYGSAENLALDIMGASGRRKSEATVPTRIEPKKEEPLDAAALRRLILAGLSKASEPVKPIVDHTPTPLPLSGDAEFDAILAPYATLLPAPQPKMPLPTTDQLASMQGEGGKDEWAGIW